MEEIEEHFKAQKFLAQGSLNLNYKYSELIQTIQEWADCLFKLAEGEVHGSKKADKLPLKNLKELWGVQGWLDREVLELYDRLELYLAKERKSDLPQIPSDVGRKPFENSRCSDSH